MGGNDRIDLKEISMRNWAGFAQDRDCWRALFIVALNLLVP
jgi:hypothetical protein